MARHLLSPLSEREEQMLRVLLTHRYLTLSQVTRLFFSSSHSEKHAHRCLQTLLREEFLTRFPLPSTTRGNRAYVYTLAGKGIRFLCKNGQEDAASFPLAGEPPSYGSIQHSLFVNDVLITARLLPQQSGMEMVLVDLKSEWMLKQAPLRVCVPMHAGVNKGRTIRESVTVIPDGFLVYRIRKGEKRYTIGIWLELDRGTEHQQQVKRKVAGIHAALTGSSFLEQCNVQNVIVAIVTTEGEKRRKDLVAWVEQELERLRKPQDADLFLCTSVPQESLLDPTFLFLEPLWTLPFGKELVPLIDCQTSRREERADA